jgi:hypothetical protein
MENTNQNNFSSQTSQIHFGHFALIVFTAAVLLFFSWMKNPQMFSFKSKVEAEKIDVAYYKYPETASVNSPQVAGASTVPEGPGILNEDGSVSPVLDLGKVLGASTDQVSASTQGIEVKTYPDTENSAVDYFKASETLEGGVIDSGTFEAALASGDQQQIAQELSKFTLIVSRLKNQTVPESFAKLHKLKILQYSAVVSILQDYKNIDSNPDLALQQLGVFTQTQKMLGDEITLLNKKFHFINQTQN